MATREGIYYATRTGQSVGETSKRTPQIVIEFDATHFGEGGEWVELPQPLSRKVYIYCSDAAWEFAKAKLESLGFNGKFDEGIDFEVTQFEVECKHETYNGKLKEKWEFPRGASEIKPLDKQTAMRMSTLWRAGAAKTPKPKGKPAAPPVAATAPSDGPGDSEDGPPGDNIPF